MRLALVADRPAITAAEGDPPADAPASGEVIDTPPNPDFTAPGAEAPAELDSTGLRPFHAVLVLEDTWTGDGRWFAAGGLGWRDLPLPMSATDTTSEQHQGAIVIGRIDSIERRGLEIHADGHWNNTPEADHYYNLVDGGFLRGVSIDAVGGEEEMLLPMDDPFMDIMLGDPNAEPPATTDDGEMVVPLTYARTRYVSAQIMGATIVPFPALAEAYIENTGDAEPAVLAAALMQTRTDVTGYIRAAPRSRRSEVSVAQIRTLAARGRSPYDIDAPVAPPAEWLDDPMLEELTPLTMSDEGQIYGHLAAWGSCHIGFSDQCVTPPTSESNYAHFHTGQLITADGSRVPVGQITMSKSEREGGHADLSLNAARAIAHYDNTCLAVADVRCGEDEFGIWIAGALRPGVEPARVRSFLAADLSGDWRRIGRSLELVAALSVNVPGFHKVRRMTQADGMVAAMVASLPVRERPHHPHQDPDAARRVALRIARSIGRHPSDRIKELSARVHGKV